MTRVEFHHNLPDKLDYACRLLRKVYRRGEAVQVVAPHAVLLSLDAALWSFSALDFIPHCSADAHPTLRTASPIVLASDCAGGVERAGVLVHLGEVVPAGFERYERLIELVSQDPDDRAQARLRWRHYADRGYPVQGHDLAVSRDRQ